MPYGPTVLCPTVSLTSYCLMSMPYGLMSYGHTVICPMVLLSYVLWSYRHMSYGLVSHHSYGPTVGHKTVRP